MKKILGFLTIMSLVFSLSANAQFDKGDKYINVGLNVGGTTGGGSGVGAAYEVGVHDFISVGAEADFINWSNAYAGYKAKHNFVSFGGRANYHFGKHFIQDEKWDLYGGVALGYVIASYKDNIVGYNNTYGSGLYFGPQVGTRYFFKPNMAALAEVGSTATTLKLGLSFKL